MSDTPSAFPPPPPGGIPSPIYQPPPVAGPPVGYPQEWQPQMRQQQQTPPQPGVGIGWGTVGILAPFEPPPPWAITARPVTLIPPPLLPSTFSLPPLPPILPAIA